jgi:hypothetical protein
MGGFAVSMRVGDDAYLRSSVYQKPEPSGAIGDVKEGTGLMAGVRRPARKFGTGSGTLPGSVSKMGVVSAEAIALRGGWRCWSAETL